MGNSNPTYLKLLTTIDHPERWHMAGRGPTYDILDNTHTLQQIQQSYVDYGSGANHDSIMQQYLFRRTQNINIVKVVFAQKMAAPYICLSNTKYRVWTERIPWRLGQLKNLQQHNILEILRQALSGFEAVYQYGKRAYVTDEMIGVTGEGLIRVWVNSNFADNRPEEQMLRTRQRPLQLLEQQVVRQIFQVVRQHTQNGIFSKNLEQKVNRDLTFREAKKAIMDYANEKNIVLRGQVSLKKGHPNQKIRDDKIQNLSDLSFGAKPQSKISTTDTIRSLVPIATPPLINSPRNASPAPLVMDSFKKTEAIPVTNIAKQKITKMHQTTLNPNPVASLQNKALHLKQQMAPLTNSKKNVNVQLTHSNRQSEPRKQPIFIQNRDSPSYTYVHQSPDLSNSQKRSISLTTMPQHQMLSIKNRPLNNQVGEKSPPNPSIPLNPSAPQNPPRENKPMEKSNPPLQFTQNSYKNKLPTMRTLSPSGGLPHHRHQSAERTKITKMDFSFDPNITPRPIVHPSPPVELKTEPWTSLQSSTNSKQLLTNSVHGLQTSGHKVESFFTHFPTVAMTQTINMSAKKDDQANESKFLEEKIKEIEQQLKHITYLESSQGSRQMLQSSHQNFKDTSIERPESKTLLK